jgi:hypothetical protein
MGKYTDTAKEDTKLLYKKSIQSFCTHSRTCSDTSHCARTGNLKLKNSLTKTNTYYKDGNKIKRDLSIETNLCIVRRYYKRKRKYSIHGASSGKTKCSTVADTEVETDFEMKPDVSASGDNRIKSETNQRPMNIDVTSRMLENLKTLLKDWIRSHVLEDAETKYKLIHVLDSIRRNLEAKIQSGPSSCSTYILDRNGEGYKVRNKKTATNPITCQYCKQKQTSIVIGRSSSLLCRKYSHLTIPFPCKHLRIISTLSIPRNMHKNKRQKLKRKSTPKKRNKAGKNVSDKKIKKVSINSSSHNTLLFRKHGICKSDNKRRKGQKRHGIVIFPKLFYDTTTDYMSSSEELEEVVELAKANNTNMETMETIPSLVMSIYADDPANITSTDKIIKYENRNDTFTMTETNTSHIFTRQIKNTVSNVQFHEATYECCKRSSRKPGLVIDNSGFKYINHSLEFPNVSRRHNHSPCLGKTRHIRRREVKSKNGRNMPKNLKSTSTSKRQCLKYNNIKYKKFMYLYRRTRNHNLKHHKFLNHLQNVFKYFADYKGKRNIKLEIHVDVLPLIEIEDKVSKESTKPFDGYDVKICPTEICDIKPAPLNNVLEDNENIAESRSRLIPLLDGAVSQSKYLFKSDNSTSKSEDVCDSTDNIADRGTFMTGLEVCKEIHELKTAIKDLSVTAEKIVAEHLRRQKEKFTNKTLVAPCATIDNENAAKKSISSKSKGIQISNTVTKGLLTSGLKLSKGPKKIEEFSNKLKKRSSSYHVIDSEAVIKVTDMTSSFIKFKEQSNKECILKKSKSLLKLKTDCKNQKLLTFFCDECKNECPTICANQGVRQIPPSRNTNPLKCNPSNTQCKRDAISIPVDGDDFQVCGDEFCSSICVVELDKPTFSIKRKGPLTCVEGCFYCILLWIPVFVILYLFYDNVLKDDDDKSTGKPKLRMPASFGDEKNMSQFILKLSDFGF